MPEQRNEKNTRKKTGTFVPRGNQGLEQDPDRNTTETGSGQSEKKSRLIGGWSGPDDYW
jgi:hypothetical protein